MYPITQNTTQSPYNYYGFYQSQNPTGNYWENNTYEASNKDDSSPQKTIGLAVILQAAAIGLQKASKWFAAKLSAGKEFTDFNNVNKVANEMIKKNNLNVNVGYIDHSNKYGFFQRYGKQLANEIETVANGKNAFFADRLKLAVAPKTKPSLILHELGHAINATKTIPRFLQNTKRYLGYFPTALLIANDLFSNKKDGKKSFIEKNAGLIGFTAFLPTIIEEGMASFRGINAAKKVLNNPKTLNILKKNYALAWCTYLLAGIGLGITAKQTILMNSDNKQA